MKRWAALAAMMLSGCWADEPRDIAVVRPPLEQCTAMGGTVQKVGLVGAPACVIRNADAGKACADGNQCIGRCLLDDWEGERPPAPGTPAQGECERSNQTFGCIAEVRQGRVATHFLCID